MKCLVCSQEPTNINDLKENHITFHRVNPDNWFLKNLFEGKNEQMLYRLHTNIGRKNIHDFIRHYEDVQVKPFEPKPMDMEQYGLITKYAYKHKDECDFYDAESCH